MTGNTPLAPREVGANNPILWIEDEPARLERDQSEVAAFAPLLQYRAPEPGNDAGFRHGGWVGELPLWPFDRPQPEGLSDLIGQHGLMMALDYSAAHPMVAPVIYPINPKPSIHEQTQAAWHVAPGGSLCLFQSEGAWQPEASITELLAKAAGWRIEYALMKAEVIERMAVRGIVSDPSSDPLILEAARRMITISTSEERADADVPQ